MRPFRHRLDGQLRAGAGFGLSHFLPKVRARAAGPGERRYMATIMGHDGQPTKRSCLETEDKQRIIEVPRFLRDGAPMTPVLHVSCDQGSIGLPALLHLQGAVGLRMTITCDIFHRIHNDLADSASQAGMTILRLEYLAVAKMRQGPFAGQANHSILSASAAEMSKVWTAECPAFQLLYRDLVAEHPEALQSADIGTESHQQRTWEWCCAELQNAPLGTSAKTSRWFSFEEQGRSSSKRRWLDVLVLCYLGVQRGWWKDATGNPLLVASSLADAPDSGLPLPGEQAENDGGVGQDGAEVSEDRPSDRRVSIAEGRAEVRKRRQKCCSILHYSCNLLCKDLNVRLWAGMCNITVPLEKAFSEMIGQVKTQAGLQQMYWELADGGMQEVSLQLVGHLCSNEFARTIDLPRCLDIPSNYIQEQNAIVLQRMWVMTYHLCGQLILTGAAYQTPPHSFLKLVHPLPEVRDAAMNECKGDWAALLELESCAVTDKDCASFVSALLVGQQQFSRECYIKLEEADWLATPADIIADLTAFSKSHLSSLICEQFFNELRDSANDNRAKRMEASNMYHIMARASKTLQNFERPSIATTAAARSAATPKLPQDFYMAQPDKYSLGSGRLDELLTPTPSWTTMSAQRLKLVPMAWRLMREHKGVWSRMKNAFLSLLVQPGSLVSKPGESKGRLVLCSTHFGMITYRMSIKHSRVVELCPIAKGSVEFISVQSLAGWKIVDTIVESWVPQGGPPSTARIVIKHSGTAHPLAMHACRRGFRGMTVDHLRRLCKILEVAEPKPPTEVNLIQALARSIMKEAATPEFIRAALAARHDCADLSDDLLRTTKLYDTDVMDALAAEFSDDEEVERQVRCLKEKREKAVRRNAERLDKVWSSRTEGGASSSSSAPSAPRPRSFVAAEANGISCAEAKRFLPDGFSLSKDDKRENRWRLRGKVMQGERSKSFGSRSDCCDWDAMVCMLQLAWREHSRVSGESMPWDFGESTT